VNGNSASARSRAAAVNPVAANKAAVSKADDKADCPCSGERAGGNSRRLLCPRNCRTSRLLSENFFYNLEGDWRVPAKGELQACSSAQEFNDRALRRNPRIALAA
jgi:hypothetical protein